MKTEDIDKKIGMPDVDAEWAKFEREVIGSNTVEMKSNHKNKSVMYKVAAVAAIVLCIGGATVASIHHETKYSDKELKIDTSGEAQPLVRFVKASPNRVGFHVAICPGVWVQFNDERGHLEHRLEGFFFCNNKRTTYKMMLDGKSFDEHSLPKLTNKDLKKLEIKNQGNGFTVVNLVTKDIKIPMQVTSNEQREMTIFIPGRGDIGKREGKWEEGDWGPVGTACWETDKYGFSIAKDINEVKNNLEIKFYVYTSTETSKADIDRLQAIFDKEGVKNVIWKKNLPISHMTDEEYRTWAQQEKAAGVPYDSLLDKAFARHIPSSDIRKQWHIVKKVYGRK